MRLLIYNIRYGTGAGKGFHLPLPYLGYLKRTTENLERITRFIKSCHPDVVGLIEADSGSFRTRQQNQVALIARELGHFHAFQSKYGRSSVLRKLPVVNKQVNAFLTSREIKNQRFHYFQKGIKRLVIELELHDVTIFLVHLSLKYRHRHDQLSDLYALVKKIKKPVIVAGDFNPFWGSTEMDLFLAATGLQNANKTATPSHPSRKPKRQLDFILHSPEIRISHFEVPRVTYSDHLPLLCDFELVKRA